MSSFLLELDLEFGLLIRCTRGTTNFHIFFLLCFILSIRNNHPTTKNEMHNNNNSITTKMKGFSHHLLNSHPSKIVQSNDLLVPLVLSQCPLTQKLMFFSQKLRNTAVTLVRQVGKSQLFILFSLFCIVGAIIVCVSLLLYYLLLLNWLLLWLMK